jgi:hypothetical protein
MELPVYWLTDAEPEDRLMTFTAGVLIAFIVMLPVERVSAFIWSTLATDAVKMPVCELKEDTLLAVKLVTVAFVAVSCPVCSLSEETLSVTMLLADTLRALNAPTWAVKEEMELPVYSLTEAATEEICWAPRVDTVAFVTVKAPIWAVTEEMELPVYRLIDPMPEDKFILFTFGTLSVFVVIIPVDSKNVFMVLTVPVVAVREPVCDVNEETVLASIVTNLPVNEETLFATTLFVEVTNEDV